MPADTVSLLCVYLLGCRDHLFFTSSLGSLDREIRTTLSMHGEARNVLRCMQGKNVQTPPSSVILTQHRFLLLLNLPSSGNCCPSLSQGMQPLPTGLALLLRGKDSEIN